MNGFYESLSYEEKGIYDREKFLFNVSEDLLVAMEDLNMPVEVLAGHLNVRKRKLSKLLDNPEDMSLQMLFDICHVLNIHGTLKKLSLLPPEWISTKDRMPEEG